ILCFIYFFFFFQAEDGIRDRTVTGVQTCALPISTASRSVLLSLFQARDELEIKIEERTAKLSRANEELQTEIIERKSAEEKLREIGRASCREREEEGGGEGVWKGRERGE